MVTRSFALVWALDICSILKSFKFFSGHEEGFRGDHIRRRYRHLPGDQELVSSRQIRDQSVSHLHSSSRKDLRLQDLRIVGHEVRVQYLV